MTYVETALLLAFLSGGGALSLALLWIANRVRWRPDAAPSGIDPILGAKDRVAIYRPSGPLIRHHPQVFIPMPDRLSTQDEMVAWMTKELPKLVHEATDTPR